MFCKGEACENLGTCYCMMSDFYEKIGGNKDEEEKKAE